MAERSEAKVRSEASCQKSKFEIILRLRSLFEPVKSLCVGFKNLNSEFCRLRTDFEPVNKECVGRIKNLDF